MTATTTTKLTTLITPTTSSTTMLFNNFSTTTPTTTTTVSSKNLCKLLKNKQNPFFPVDQNLWSKFEIKSSSHICQCWQNATTTSRQHMLEISIGTSCVDFTNVLRAAFTLVDLKIKLSHQYLFTILGSAPVKAVLRALMKLSPEYEKEMRILV